MTCSSIGTFIFTRADERGRSESFVVNVIFIEIEYFIELGFVDVEGT